MSDEDASTYVPMQVLFDFSRDALESAGLTRAAAQRVATSLVEADARSLSSHGVVRLLAAYVRRLKKGSTNPVPDIRTVRQRGGVAVLDGDGAPGQVVGHLAMEMAIDLARQNGVGSVGVRNSSHFGIGALYVEQAAKEDMIGLALTNATPNMPPAGGRGRFLGTNPLAIGIPGGDSTPIVLDMSTSVVARGRIVMAHKAQQQIPSGWAVDKNGHPTVDAGEALEGAVLPLAGYKGAGLALMIDALCGVLTGAAFGPHVTDLYDEGEGLQNVGHFFAAFSIDGFMPVAMFRERLAQFVSEVCAQPRLPGVERIYLPGEIEFEARDRAVQSGIPIAVSGWSELSTLAKQLGITSLADRLGMTAVTTLGDPVR